MNKFLVVYDKHKLQIIEDASHLNKLMVISKLKDTPFALPTRLQGLIFASPLSNRTVSIFSTELNITQITDLHESDFSQFEKITRPGIIT